MGILDIFAYACQVTEMSSTISLLRGRVATSSDRYRQSQRKVISFGPRFADYLCLQHAHHQNSTVNLGTKPTVHMWWSFFDQ